MKSLTRNQMKNVKGGGPILPNCPYGDTCQWINSSGQTQYSYCGNVFKNGSWQCGCINSGLLCWPGGTQ